MKSSYEPGTTANSDEVRLPQAVKAKSLHTIETLGCGPDHRLTGRQKLVSLQPLLSSFGLFGQSRDDWFLPKGRLPAIRGVWHETGSGGLLSVQILLQEGGLLEEKCYGAGTVAKSLTEALRLHLSRNLTPMLAAVWNAELSQVNSAVWSSATDVYVAYWGPLIAPGELDSSMPPPGSLIRVARENCEAQCLCRGLHVVRLSARRRGTSRSFEATLDGSAWHELSQRLDTLPAGRSTAMDEFDWLLLVRVL